MQRPLIFLTSMAIVLFQLFSSGNAMAEAFTPFPASSGEFSYQMGYGVTHRGFGETRTRVQTVDFIGRFGYFLTDEMGTGWYRGQYEHVLELPLHLVVDPKTRTMAGGNLLGKWNFTALKDTGFMPYVFGGGGVLFVDLGLHTMGSRLDFSYGGGSGVQYFFRKDTAVSAEWRYHHISNANTAEPNEPLNSSKFLIGIALFR